MEFCFDAQTVQKGCGVRFCFPSVHFRKFTFQLAGADAVFICKVFLCIYGFFFLHNLIQSGVSHNNCIQNRIGVVFKVILLQERKTLSRCDHNVAVGGLKLSGQDLQKSRFSCAVGANETVAVSFCKFDVDIFKQGFFSNPQSDVIC